MHRSDRAIPLKINKFIFEAQAGIAPAYEDFADPCLTTWLLRRALFVS